jgi:putative isomerase
MDNAVRFDDAVMVQNGPGAWSLDQESVDLNAYLYAEKGYLSVLAEVLGREEEARTLKEEQEALGALIRDTFYFQDPGYFYDVDLDTKEPIRVEGPEGWIPLWAGIATPAQAEGVARVMMDPRKFFGAVPLPTLTMDHPAFDPSNGYWRGPVWLDQAYFGMEGLRSYGFEDEAREIARRLLVSAEGLSGSGPLFENYHPVTGEGLNAAHFSWSAAHLLMLFKEGFMAWDDPRS